MLLSQAHTTRITAAIFSVCTLKAARSAVIYDRVYSAAAAPLSEV